MSETNADELAEAMATVATLTAERDAARSDLMTERVARCFDGSQFIKERLTAPADLLSATFGKHFTIENGRPVAKDSSGQKIMSRLGRGAADFDEALAILISQTDFAEKITRRPRGDGEPPTANWSVFDKRPNASLPPLTRAAYDKMPPRQQAAWAMAGGRVN